MGMTSKMKASLNQLWKNLPGMRGGTESTNMRLGDLLGDIEHVVVDVQIDVALAAAASTAVASAKAKVGDLAVATLVKPNGGATVAKVLRASIAAAGTVTVTPDATPSDATGLLSVVVYRKVSSAVAGHSENPGA